MSAVTIQAEHGGLTVAVTVSTTGTADDYALVLDRALRSVAVALAPPADSAPPSALFDQEATQPLPVSEAEYRKRLEEVPY